MQLYRVASARETKFSNILSHTLMIGFEFLCKTEGNNKNRGSSLNTIDPRAQLLCCVMSGLQTQNSMTSAHVLWEAA